MPRNKGSFELSSFLRGRIVGQSEAGLSQREISKNLCIPLATINRIIVQFRTEQKQKVSPRSGRPSGKNKISESSEALVEKFPAHNMYEDPTHSIPYCEKMQAPRLLMNLGEVHPAPYHHEKMQALNIVVDVDPSNAMQYNDKRQSSGASNDSIRAVQYNDGRQVSSVVLNGDLTQSMQFCNKEQASNVVLDGDPTHSVPY